MDRSFCAYRNIVTTPLRRKRVAPRTIVA